MRRMGVDTELRLIRPGFYPAGGGEIHIRITPVKRRGALHIKERGDAAKQTIREKPELAEKITKAVLEKANVTGGTVVTGEVAE